MTTNLVHCDDNWSTVSITYDHPIACCQYREDCIDVDTDKCKRCAHNRKRSYFCPVDYWPRPYDYIPYWPYYYQPYTFPYIGTLTGADNISCTTTRDDSTPWSYTTSSHFVEAK